MCLCMFVLSSLNVLIYIYIQLEYLSGLEPGTKLGTMNPLHDCTCLEVVLQLRWHQLLTPIKRRQGPKNTAINGDKQSLCVCLSSLQPCLKFFSLSKRSACTLPLVFYVYRVINWTGWRRINRAMFLHLAIAIAKVWKRVKRVAWKRKGFAAGCLFFKLLMAEVGVKEMVAWFS